MPTPYSPAPGSSMPAAGAAFARNLWGTCRSMPAPSPVFTSQPHAPRCSRFRPTSNACRTSLCDRSPLMLTTNPTPHESCSNRGS